MSLLAEMGWDCPGAVQMSDPDRVDEMLCRSGTLEHVTAAQIGRRLERLQDQSASWTEPGEHWSLAGQQSKFALSLTPDGWAEAKGSAPTTHIFKPGIGTLGHQGLVEHATTSAAGKLGVDVAASAYTEFGGHSAIVVSRFDRIQLAAGGVVRLHQEDMCQAVGRSPDESTKTRVARR